VAVSYTHLLSLDLGCESEVFDAHDGAGSA